MTPKTIRRFSPTAPDGPIRSWVECMEIFNQRNPRQPFNNKQSVQETGHRAIRKLRKALADLAEDFSG